jgi:hypothetical protein
VSAPDRRVTGDDAKRLVRAIRGVERRSGRMLIADIFLEIETEIARWFEALPEPRMPTWQEALLATPPPPERPPPPACLCGHPAHRHSDVSGCHECGCAEYLPELPELALPADP